MLKNLLLLLLLCCTSLQSEAQLNCQNLSVTTNYLQNPAVDGCCFSFDLGNGIGSSLTSICVDLTTIDWVFVSGSLVLDPAYNLISETTTQICFDHPGGFPTGTLLDVIEFCINDTDASAPLPQHLDFTWFEGATGQTCTENLFLDCTPTPVTPPCGWALATCYAGVPSEPVGALFDVSMNSIAPNGDDWVPTIPGEIHPTNWMLDSIGQVFGTAWDANYNAYLAASDIYAYDASPVLLSGAGPAGTAGIYKGEQVNSYNAFPFVNTLISASANTSGTDMIPNTGGFGNGLGNIAYDVTHDQFFATNLEDGRIYRINNLGIVQSIYDPFSLDGGVAGLASPANERVWGVGVYTRSGVRKVYFAREALGGSNNKEIWSVPLTGSGEFDNTGGTAPGGILTGSSLEVLELDVVYGNMEKLTDIAFSFAGNMLITERGHPHDAMVLEYDFDGTNWNFLRKYFVGWSAQGENSAGGVDYGYSESMGDIRAECDGLVWASGYNSRPAALSPGRSYGISGMASSGNASHPSNSATDIFLDFDGVYNYGDKRRLGDVEIAKCGCPTETMVNCDSLNVIPRSNSSTPAGGDDCCWSIDLINNVGSDISKVCVDINTADWIFNTGALILDAGYTWETNTSTQICFEHAGGFPSGTLPGVLEFCLLETDTSATLPQELIFSWFEGPQNVLCSDTLYFDCDPPHVEEPCLTLDKFEADCVQGNDSEYCVSFEVTNNTSFPAYALILENLPGGYGFADCGCGGAPYGVGLLDYVFDWFGSPLAPGDTRMLCVKIIAGSPILSTTDICINGTIEGLTECCSSPTDFCFPLEPCCDPCESTTVDAVQMQGDGCCYSMSPNFGCTFDYFTRIEFDILTPDVVFASHALGDPGFWNVCTTPTLTNVCIEPLTPEIPSGAYPDLFTFCLGEIGDAAVPQSINVKFWTVGANGQDSVACDTTLLFDCPITELPCSFITNEEIVCVPDSGKYIITVDVQNISNPDFTAEYLAFLPTTGLSPNPVPLVPALPNDGSTRTVSFCYTPAVFPDADNELVLVYRLKDVEGDSCCNGNTAIFDTLTLPDCIECEPELVCPDDIIVDCCGFVQLPEPVLTDTCGGHVVNCIRDDGLPLGDPFMAGVTTINCLGQNAVGDSVTCSYTVTVLDTFPPMIACPDTIVLMGNTICQATLEDLTTSIQVIEACGEYTITQSIDPGTVLNEGEHIINIVVTDACGNVATCAVLVVVECIGCDPELICPDDIVVDCCGFVQLAEPVLTDSCGGHVVNCVRDDGLPLGDPFMAGVTTINCIGQNAIGDSITCSYTVTVLDTFPPVINCPDSIFLIGNSACQATLENLTTSIQVTEACGDYTITQSIDPGTVLNAGENIVNIVVTDACGNVATCAIVVIVECPNVQCECGSFNTLAVLNSTGSQLDVTAGTGIAYTLPCPVEDRSLYFEYECPDPNCPWNNRFIWNITDPLGTVTSGITNSPGGVGASIPLSAADFTENGLYIISMTTMCGDQECPYTIELINECPQQQDCDCEMLEPDFFTDVPNGFDPQGGLYPDVDVWTAGCNVYYRPVMLGACDKITWTLNNATAGTTSIMASNGNSVISFPFISGNSYVLTILVERVLPDGTQCSVTYTYKFRRKCLQDVEIVCDEDFVLNPDFEVSTIDWTNFSGTSVFVQDGGSDGNGHLVLSGGFSAKDGMVTEVKFTEEPSTSYRIGLKVLNKNVLPNTSLVLRTHAEFPSDLSCLEDCDIVGEVIFNPEENAEWTSVEPFYIEDLQKYLSLHLTSNYPNNDNPDSKSVIGVDEICIESVSDTITTVRELSAGLFNIFPNPTRSKLTILTNSDQVSDYSIRIIDLVGHNIPLKNEWQAGPSIDLDLDHLSPGIYWINIQTKDGQIWNEKIHKNNRNNPKGKSLVPRSKLILAWC